MSPTAAEYEETHYLGDTTLTVQEVEQWLQLMMNEE